MSIKESFNRLNEQRYEINDNVRKMIEEAIEEIGGEIEANSEQEYDDNNYYTATKIKSILGFNFDHWEAPFTSPEILSEFLETYKKDKNNDDSLVGFVGDSDTEEAKEFAEKMIKNGYDIEKVSFLFYLAEYGIDENIFPNEHLNG